MKRICCDIFCSNFQVVSRNFDYPTGPSVIPPTAYDQSSVTSDYVANDVQGQRSFDESRDENEISGVDFNSQKEIDDWQNSVPGVPGKDYPNLKRIPRTSFSCSGKKPGGYYADVETGCQVGSLNVFTRISIFFALQEIRFAYVFGISETNHSMYIQTNNGSGSISVL